MSSCFAVVLALFLHGCFLVGTIKAMGVFLQDMSVSLGTTSTDIGTILGLFLASCFFPAPFFAAFYRRCPNHHRIGRIIAATMIPLGVILVSFASSNAQVAVFLIISGLGHCLLRIMSVSSLSEISPNFNLLLSLAFCGYAVGMVLLPLLAAALVEPYGWRGGVLILGALMGNILPCACSYGEHQMEDEMEDEIGVEIGDKQLLKCPKRCHRIKSASMSHDALTHECSRDTLTERALNSIGNLDLFNDPSIIFINLSTLVHEITYAGWHAFLIPHALQRGISLYHVVIITLCASVGNLLGRLLGGVLTHRFVKPVDVYLIETLVNVGFLLCYAFIKNFFAMLVLSFLSAFAILGRTIMPVMIVRERASPDKFPVMLAILDIFLGTGTLLGGYISGMIADRFSFDATFIFLAGVDALAFLLMIPPRLVKKPKDES